MNSASSYPFSSSIHSHVAHQISRENPFEKSSLLAPSPCQWPTLDNCWQCVINWFTRIWRNDKKKTAKTHAAPATNNINTTHNNPLTKSTATAMRHSSAASLRATAAIHSEKNYIINLVLIKNFLYLIRRKHAKLNQIFIPTTIFCLYYFIIYLFFNRKMV